MCHFLPHSRQRHSHSTLGKDISAAATAPQLAVPDGSSSLSSCMAQSICRLEIGRRQLEDHLWHLGGVQKHGATHAASLRPTELAETLAGRTCWVSKHVAPITIVFSPFCAHKRSIPRQWLTARVSNQVLPWTPHRCTQKRKKTNVRWARVWASSAGRRVPVRVALLFSMLSRYLKKSSSCFLPTSGEIQSGQCGWTSSNCRLASPAEGLQYRLKKAAA